MGKPLRIVIVGGVAGGASAAARARRLSEDAEIILIERGKNVSFANCGLPYYIGGVIKERERLLVQTPKSLYANMRIDVRVNAEVTKIDRAAKKVSVKTRETEVVELIEYDKLILSPGAEPIRPNIPGSDDSRIRTLRSMADMDTIVAELKQAPSRRSLIVGGGYIGLEMTEAFIEKGLDVTLVELASQVMGPIDPEMASIVHDQLRSHGVDLRLETSVTSFESKKDALLCHLSNGEVVECGMVIMAIGVRPETKLAKDAGLELGARGGIKVDTQMITSDPDIYAVGDAIEVNDFILGTPTLIPLAGPANRQGRIAADNIFGRKSSYRGTQGTAICKVFDLAVGITGASEKLLQRTEKAYQKIYVHPTNHASYYPGATPISLKLLFDPTNGKVLGAQAIGFEGVDKRIDVIAMAIQSNLSVYDLEEAELSYAPPYGSAKDVVNYAGFVAANVLHGDTNICHFEDVLNLKEGQYLLDVRTIEEFSLGTIPGAQHISLQELRDRYNEIPKDKEILVFCQVGLRGYLASRILQEKGYVVRNLSGGYKTYRMFMSSQKQDTLTSKSDITNSIEAKGQKRENNEFAAAKTIDCVGLQCPGPIMKVAETLKEVNQGGRIEVAASDSAFCSDIKGWCASTGNQLIDLTSKNGLIKAIIEKGAAPMMQTAMSKKTTIVVFSGDFDKLMAAFIIANGSASMGSEVTMFFTFWGLNALRKPISVPVTKNLIEKMFGWMMPRGAERLKLSQMNMGGMGLAMIKGIMRSKKVQSLSELIVAAQKQGVHIVACSMSMDLMGLKKEELIDGIEEGGVSMYLSNAEQGRVNLFI